MEFESAQVEIEAEIKDKYRWGMRSFRVCTRR